jgi:hypothetical protein
MGQLARLWVLAGVVPAANIVFFSGIFLFGLNSDEHRKYDADLWLDRNTYMERLERRARGFSPERGSPGERDFKTDFSDVLKIRQQGQVPSAELARLLQDKFLRPIRDCLESVHSRAENAASSDASDPYSRAIAHALRANGTILDSSRQDFVIAADRGKIYWKSCTEFLPGMEYLLDNFQTWDDVLAVEKRAALTRRLKAIVDRLFWDSAVLTMDRAGASKADLGRAYQAIDRINFEVKGACFDGPREGDSSRLADICNRSRDTLLSAANELLRFVGDVGQSVEQSQTAGRRSVEEFFHANYWKIAIYFILIWLANLAIASLALKWRMPSHHTDTEPGGESGAMPRPSPVPGHGLPS